MPKPFFLFAFPLKLFSNLLPTPFQYMGLWLLLCFILQAIFSWELHAKITRDNWLKFLAVRLLIVCLLLTLIALSNQIVFGQHELIQYKLPSIAGIFMASGRMFWPVYYVLYLTIFYLIIKPYKGLFVKILLLMCLVIQLFDSQHVYRYFRNSLSHVESYVSPLQSSLRLEAAKNIKKLFMCYLITFLKHGKHLFIMRHLTV